jgi:hypothetical protein
MELMAEGLAGNEAEFYLYVNQSSWLGGDQEYSTLNEAFPYWFNGAVPLAYGLDDERLKAQVQRAVDYVIGHQQEVSSNISQWLEMIHLSDLLIRMAGLDQKQQPKQETFG